VPLPAQTSKQPTSRTISRTLRAYEHWDKRAKQFGNLFRKTNHLGLFDSSSTAYAAWRNRWSTLFGRIAAQQNRVFATAKLQTSFLEWLVWVAKVKVPSNDLRHRQTGLVRFAELVEAIRPLDLDYPAPVIRHGRVEKKESKYKIPDHEPYQYLHGRKYICSFCGREAPVFRLHSCHQRYQRSLRGRKSMR
jgi:hypothetical protein